MLAQYNLRTNFSEIGKKIFILFLFFCITFPVFGEGSATYNTNNTDERMYYSGEARFRVYVRPGDKVYIGSSSKTVTVNYLDTGVTQQYTTTAARGLISNRTMEAAGPKPLNSNGYNPITINVSREGYIDITFSADNCRYTGAANNTVAAAFRNMGNSNCYSVNLLTAFDITVVNSSGTVIPGRTFTSSLKFHHRAGSVIFVGYVLSNDGYIYNVDTGKIYGITWTFLVNNRGIVYTPNNSILYASVARAINQVSDYISFIERYKELGWYDDFEKFTAYLAPELTFDPNVNGDLNFRVFFSYPDTDLLNYLDMAIPKDLPELTNFSFTGSYQNNESLINQGGTFSFEASDDYGTYELILSFPNDLNNERTVVFGDNIQLHNEITWNGKDAVGNTINVGEYTAVLKVKTGEMHVLFEDIEQIYDGLKIKNMQKGNSIVYFNDKETYIDGTSTHMNSVCWDAQGNPGYGVNGCGPVNLSEHNGNIVNSNDNSMIYYYGNPDGLSGVDSYLTPIIKTSNRYSDVKTLNVWTYGDSAEYTSIYKIVDPHKDIVVEKQWVDDNNRDGYRTGTILFRVLGNNIEISGSPFTLPIGNDWSITIPSLPMFDNQQNPIVYTVEEL